MKVSAVQVTQRGQLTLPKVLRDKYQIKPGQQFALLDLEGASLEGMMADLRRKRETDDMA